MDLRSLQAFGSGVGIEIRGEDLEVVLTRVRPSGIDVLSTLAIRQFRQRPAAEWGAEYASFLRQNGASHLSATVVLPRHEVIARLIVLPGIAKADLESAIGFEADSLHPWGDEEVVHAWQKVSASGAVLVGLVRRAVLDSYLNLFTEAGVAVASVTFSAGLLHSAIRLLGAPLSGFLTVTAGETGEWELYGESPARPVFSAELQLPAERAIALALAELRLGELEPTRLSDALPQPRALPGAEFPRSTLGYAASLAGACPRLAAAANLLPAELRRTNSRALFLPTLALAALLLLTCGAILAFGKYVQHQDRAMLRAEIAKLEPLSRRVAALDKEIGLAQARSSLLDRFRNRSKADLDALNELTHVLRPPVWINLFTMNRDNVTLAGEAEQAAPLLKTLDDSPQFQRSSFVISIQKRENTEAFRIRTEREPR